MSFNFNDPFIIKNMYKGTFGIEKESLRIDTKGFLSHTKHPFYDNPHIDRDFCENQIEIVTDVYESTQSVYDHLERINNTVLKCLNNLKSGKELLWPFSNPPYIKGENDIPIASFKENFKGKELYRKYLAEKYGKKKMLFSGIHFNFSFGDELFEEGYNENISSSFTDYKNNIYLELAKKITSYSWLIVYLTAASPVMNGSYIDESLIKKNIVTPYSSVRCSEIGYWNNFIPILKYDNLKNYISSIQYYVDKGQLKSFSELYYPIRLKSGGENSLESLALTGVNHIELRMLDLNPLSPVGIMKEDLDFIHILIIYLMSQNDEDFTENKQIKAVKNVKLAAKFDDENTVINFLNEKLPLKSTALKILCNMENFFKKYGQTDALEIIKYQKDKIFDKNKRYAKIIRKNFGKNYVEKGLELSFAYTDSICKKITMNV